jgi:hypothetical protein
LRMSMAIEFLLPFGPKEFKRMPIIQWIQQNSNSNHIGIKSYTVSVPYNNFFQCRSSMTDLRKPYITEQNSVINFILAIIDVNII